MDDAFEIFELERGNIRYVVEFVYDDSYHCDWIGEYSDRWRPGAIDMATWRKIVYFQHCPALRYTTWGPSYNQQWTRGSPRWFIPNCTPEEVRRAAAIYSTWGMSRHEAWLKASRIPLQQYAQMQALGNTWWLIGIVVTAYVDDGEICRASLWGIEYGDMPGTNPQDQEAYYDEVIEDLISECRSQFKDTAERLSRVVEILEQEEAKKKERETEGSLC